MPNSQPPAKGTAKAVANRALNVFRMREPGPERTSDQESHARWISTAVPIDQPASQARIKPAAFGSSQSIAAARAVTISIANPPANQCALVIKSTRSYSLASDAFKAEIEAATR